MKRVVLLLACCVVTACFAAAAQESTTAASASTSGDTFRKIEGCLAYNGVSYVLAVVSNGPKQYRVVGGDVAALKGKEGHTVEIDGTTGSNNPAEMVQNWDQRQATTGVGWYTIAAEHVRDVTSNCSYPGFEKPPSYVHMN